MLACWRYKNFYMTKDSSENLTQFFLDIDLWSNVAFFIKRREYLSN